MFCRGGELCRATAIVLRAEGFGRLLLFVGAKLARNLLRIAALRFFCFVSFFGHDSFFFGRFAFSSTGGAFFFVFGLPPVVSVCLFFRSFFVARFLSSSAAVFFFLLVVSLVGFCFRRVLFVGTGFSFDCGW